MADELNDGEIENLLAAGKRRPPGDPTDLDRTPLSYDFKRPQHLNKDQLRMVEDIHEQFARLFSASYASSMRMVVDADLAFIDQIMYNEFASALPTPCSAYSFNVSPSGNRAVLSFAPSLLMALIDRALGGSGLGVAEEGRALTKIEVSIVDRLARRVVGNIEAAWKARAPIEITDLVLETSPEFIQAAAPGEGVVVVAVEANANRTTGLVQLCYPLAVLEPLLPKRVSHLPAKTKQTEALRARQTEALGKVRLPVVLQLARGTLTLSEVSRLRQGDVVKLDTRKNEPAVVFIGDRPKFLGRPGLRQRQRAVQIVEAIDPQDEESYR
ncbi:MAG: flagellar motor switch protein FliM [Candidatus Handelsmanbacteria bacterium]|nr:flagellar motor switch protein FliM [Candidatus Handelsmanbacteria bacterium]